MANLRFFYYCIVVRGWWFTYLYKGRYLGVTAWEEEGISSFVGLFTSMVTSIWRAARALSSWRLSSSMI